MCALSRVRVGERHAERRRLITEELGLHLVDDVIGTVQHYAEQPEILGMANEHPTLTYDAAANSWSELTTALPRRSANLGAHIYWASDSHSASILLRTADGVGFWERVAHAEGPVGPIRVVVNGALHCV